MKTDIRPYTRQFYLGNSWRLLIAMIEAVASTAASLLISWLIQQIIDLCTGMDTGFTFRQLFLLSLGAMGFMILSYTLAFFSRPRFISKAMAQYKEFIFERLCRKGISAFSGENSALYISALSNDAASIESGYLTTIFVLVSNSLLFVGALGLMFWYSPLLTLISIGLSLLPLAASICTGSLVAKAETQVSDHNEIYMSSLKDSLTGFSVIKTFRAEARMCRIFAEKVRQVAKAKCLRDKLGILVEFLGSASGASVQFGVMLIGAWMALSGADLTAGSVLVFVQLLNYVISPIAQIPAALAKRKAARALIQKIATALEENVREEGSEEKSVLEQGITLENLSFGYEPEKPVLQNLDFTFLAGKRYALVGASGSGKSTLLNLLLASYPQYSGAIRYDETELRQLKSENLYELVCQIQQNVFIFNASIRDNITMFSDFPKEAVDRAIRLSGLDALIAEKGEGYLCGENGSGLSGGERQRVSIARALLKNAQVLLVDEATASLDAQTAFHVTNAILDLENITRILVTHSLEESLMQRFDCILAMKNGRIQESGTFEELMAQKGYFYSLFNVSQ